jgi:uncharacterized membrane protein HdeD (DUF308 family)
MLDGLVRYWWVVAGLTATRLRRELEGEWLLAVSGVASIVLGLPFRQLHHGGAHSSSHRPTHA